MLHLLLHLIGDYVTQSDWMAQNKTKSSWAALCHATVYALPFLVVASMQAWLVIWLSHFVIDRWRLARYLTYAKNWLAPRSYWHPWSECSVTGYHQDKPQWLTFWLMVTADNTVHLTINEAALTWL